MFSLDAAAISEDLPVVPDTVGDHVAVKDGRCTLLHVKHDQLWRGLVVDDILERVSQAVRQPDEGNATTVSILSMARETFSPQCRERCMFLQ